MTRRTLDPVRAAEIAEVLRDLGGPQAEESVTSPAGADVLDEIGRGVDALVDELSALRRAVDVSEVVRPGAVPDAPCAKLDELTGVPNRSLLIERLREVLAEAEAGGQPPSVLLLDLDRFKEINDDLGHSAGDAVLVTVASRLLACSRPTDTVARLGGDEFAVVLPATDSAGAVAVAERIVEQLAVPIRVGWRTVWTGGSVGVCTAERGQRADQVLRYADTAMYAAKSNGSGRVRQFVPEMNAAARRRSRIAAEIAAALVEGHLRVRYRPEVDLGDRRSTGVEAVVEWVHPRRGLLPAARFLDVAEDGGHIVEIGRWVRRSAFARWAASPGGPARLLVHVSPVELRTADLAEGILRDLAAAGIDPARLVLVVRDAALAHQDSCAELTRLREHGIQVQLDGFGAGDIPLPALRHHPVDAVRLDAALVAAAVADERDARYLSALVVLAGSVDLRVTAAGVDRPEHARMLLGLGCATGQGSWCGRETGDTSAGAPGGPDPAPRAVVRPVRAAG